jgi:hypothetical protein
METRLAKKLGAARAGQTTGKVGARFAQVLSRLSIARSNSTVRSSGVPSK